MSNHTPGPWETTWPKFNCTIESRGGVVATVYVGQTLSDSESEANAYLIAAAPELLKFARGAWHLCESLLAVRDGIPDESIRAMANALRAAIDKAEGKDAR